ncbi:MAG: S9 family peptidase [Pseudomonadota bacterium]|jgi:oligopeptidase B|nr:MAG: oligopeptidase B [Pseudomonadota bacterium]
MSAPAQPPVAAARPHRVESPHGTREDPYYWLRDDTRSDPEVLAYLEAENAWTDAVLAPLKPLQERIYQEIIGRIRQDDMSVPWRRNGYWYYSRYETGANYPIHARRRGSMDAPEEVMLDVSALAAVHDFYQVGSWDVSPDNRLLAFTEDTVGRRQFVLRVKDLVTGEMLADAVPNVEPGAVWAADSRTLLYVAKDPVTLLGDKVFRHVLGTDPSADVLVYRQEDPAFYTGVGRTKDDRFLLIVSSSTVSTEYQVAAADDPVLPFRVLLPRERDHEYQAEHLDGRWILLTNWQAKNFRIVEAREEDLPYRERWRELVPHREDAFIEGFEVFRDFLAVEERSGGLLNVRVRDWQGGREFLIGADEPSYAIQLGQNPEIDTGKVRYLYTSLTTPVTTYDFDVATGERTLLKREPVLGDFRPEDYATEFLWVTVRDGTRVPVSLVYRRDRFRRDGSAPLLQYAYGAYGISSDPRFSIPLLSLLDRGFVYAIAHVRGGQELGRSWYEAGKLLDKRNTFNDFIDVTRHLAAAGYADRGRVFARGGSAGGLLMGAVANMAPEDYCGLIALVPFVDIVTTMLDESIPLTTNEYDEWGDPREQQYYEYMLGYSPYDNVERKAYPAMYVGTGLWDSQVQYFEPAKWVAKLRAMKTDSNPLVFRVNMEAGHGGKSGRFRQFLEVAEQWAFIAGLAGILD